MNLPVKRALCLCLGSATLGMSLHGGLNFLPLGDLPGGQTFSVATGVSADGSTVVGGSFSARGEEAFKWTLSEGMAALGELPNGVAVTHASAVSEDGKVIVGVLQWPNLDEEAFRWTASTGFAGLGHLAGGARESLATDVSADGSVVVGYSSSTDGDQAFRWTGETGMTSLGDLPGAEFSSIALAVSADGLTVVGRSRYGSGSVISASGAFRWRSDAGMIVLSQQTGAKPSSEASATSADGRIIVGTYRDGDAREAFQWQSAAMAFVGLGDLPGWEFDSQASDISAGGSRIVGEGNAVGVREAVLWDESLGIVAIRDLLTEHGIDMSKWWLDRAGGISADGNVVVGSGHGPNGPEAWLVTGLNSIPEPCTGALWIAGIGFLLSQRRRCNRRMSNRKPE